MLKTLHYSEHIPQNTTTALNNFPVVVLLHGLFGSSDNLSVIRRALQDQYRVISIDLPDHGQSPRSTGFSFESYAQRVVFTLHKLNITNANLIGHSLGGKVAMWIAHKQPQLIDKLIVLDIAPVAYEPRHQNVINGLTAVPLNKIDSRKHAQQFMAKFIVEAGTQSFLLKSLYEEKGNWHWRFNLNLLVKDYALLSDWTLAGHLVYNEQVLFIKGENSDYITAEHRDTISIQFPKAKAKLVKAGHWLHAEKPQIVNSLITKYLRGA
jgi:esterase